MAHGLEAAIFPNVKRRHFGAVTVGRVEKTAGPLYREERWIGTCLLDRDQLPLTGLIYTEYRNSLSAPHNRSAVTCSCSGLSDAIACDAFNRDGYG